MEQWKSLYTMLQENQLIDQEKLTENFLDVQGAIDVMKKKKMTTEMAIIGDEDPIEMAEKENQLIGDGQFEGIDPNGTPEAI